MSWDEDIRPPVKPQELEHAIETEKTNLKARLWLLAFVALVIIVILALSWMGGKTAGVESSEGLVVPAEIVE